MDVEFAELSDPGRQRSRNEDYLGHVAPPTPAFARSHGWLFALADGVGGQDKGEVASRTAIECLTAAFRSAHGNESHAVLLPRLVQSANARVYETGMSTGRGGTAMATTMVAAALRHDQATVAHVGDSRCYLVRQGVATALTRDHTIVNEQVRLGVISRGEAENAITKHVLSRSLGNDLFVNVDYRSHQLNPGDVLMLCTDGLHGAVEPGDISDILGSARDLPGAAQDLVRLANERDGSDNISVQIIRVKSVERMGMYRGRPYRLH